MEPDIVRGLGPTANNTARRRATAYFDEIKLVDHGIQVAASALLNDQYQNNNDVKFFMWKILEHQIQYRYHELSEDLKAGMRTALLTWLQKFSRNPNQREENFVKNKSAQVFGLIFTKEYLTSWTTFPQDILNIVASPDLIDGDKNNGVDMYLRILKAIDIEVVDRTFLKSPAHANHCQQIKDVMRDQCVKELVESWYYILTTNINVTITSLCLKIVGRYIEWIDVNLIVNNRFMVAIFNYLNSEAHVKVRESACKCLAGVADKGMPPSDKMSLVASLWQALEEKNIFQFASVSDAAQIEFVVELSALVAKLLIELVEVHAQCENGSELHDHILDSARNKLSVVLQFFISEDDDVSSKQVDAIKAYVDLEKKAKKDCETRSELVKQLLFGVISKLKYDEDYDFQNQGEDEAEFDEFLKSLKVLLENVVLLSPELCITHISGMLKETLQRWTALPYNQVEVVIRVFYLVGESLQTANFSTIFARDPNGGGATDSVTRLHMREMMKQLVMSNVVSHQHSCVRRQYFETIVRYDRYFQVTCAASAADNEDGYSEEERRRILVDTLMAFLDERGLRSDDLQLRSRCSYLFSRFVKTLGKVLNPFAEEILKQVGQLLELSSSSSSTTDASGTLLSPNDHMFMYELCGHVIVNASLPANHTAQLLTALLRPLVADFDNLLGQMVAHARSEPQNGSDVTKAAVGSDSSDESEKVETQSEILAKKINYSMGFASRTSKAFTSKQTMTQLGCNQVYRDTLQVFMSVLSVQYHRDILHIGFRQYMHRMVTCLDDDVLNYIPPIVRELANNQQPRALIEFIPFFNQIISKFRKRMAPYAQEIFMLVVRAVFQVLAHKQQINNNNCNGAAAHTQDELVRSTKQHYYNFLLALVTGGLTQVIVAQDKDDLEQVLATLVQGAVDFSEPITRKAVFQIMTKMVESWECDEEMLWEICRDKFLPSCFQAPLSHNFDLQDAQTVLVLNESCNLMKAVTKKQSDRVESYLRDYCLPSLNFSKSQIQDYFLALRHPDNKTFRNYSKELFKALKT